MPQHPIARDLFDKACDLYGEGFDIKQIQLILRDTGRLVAEEFSGAAWTQCDDYHSCGGCCNAGKALKDG